MPVWHELTKEWVRKDELAVVGVIQEQHPERCLLYAQWQAFDWPILHDPLNSLGLTAVPIIVALDEHGIVRAVNPKPTELESSFLRRDFANDAKAKKPITLLPDPDLEQLRALAEEAGEGIAWQLYGDSAMLFGRDPDTALEAYERAFGKVEEGPLLFRMGVAYRMRHESAAAQSGDSGRAFEHWTRALETNSNQYIWRRRLQQYGPRLTKPYPFYDWVTEAEDAIRARGEEPVALAVRPSGAEIAQPTREFSVVEASSSVEPDPKDEIRLDEARRVDAELSLVPPRPERTARLHMTFRPREGAVWDPEAGRLKVWIEAPEGWQVSRSMLEAPVPRAPHESLRLDVEIRLPEGLGASSTAFRAYALYFICESEAAQCVYLRQNLALEVQTDG